MNVEDVSVLVVDDSALMRNLIGRIIENAEGLVLAGKAMNGKFALQKIPRLDPDVIILDLEMPEMNGIEFLKERKERGINIPVVILSSIARRGAKITMEALSLGASDFLLKPSGSISEDINTISKQIVQMVRAYGLQYRRNRSTPRRVPPAVSVQPEAVQFVFRPATVAAPQKISRKERKKGPVEIIAIGISTGGPNALRTMFSMLDKDLKVPIVVVQHMPAGFTEEFAKSLSRICPLEVREGREGDILVPGRIIIAPGNYHIEVEKKRLGAVLHLSDRGPVNGHRPSVDVLFASVAKNYGGSAMAIIMTGMGKDGAAELGSIYAEGGITLAQDEYSSVVYGMPKVAYELGFVQQVVPLSDMAATVAQIVRECARDGVAV